MGHEKCCDDFFAIALSFITLSCRSALAVVLVAIFPVYFSLPALSAGRCALVEVCHDCRDGCICGVAAHGECHSGRVIAVPAGERDTRGRPRYPRLRIARRRWAGLAIVDAWRACQTDASRRSDALLFAVQRAWRN